MKLTWNLDELYLSFEDDKFQNDIKYFSEKVDEYKKLAGNVKELDDLEGLERFIEINEEIYKVYMMLYNYASLTISTDSNNKTAAKYSDKLDKIKSSMAEPDAVLQKWISGIENLDDVISKSEKLQKYKFLINEIKANSKYLLSDREEKIIAEMKNTGSSAWEKLKDNLISNLLVDVEDNGETKQLPLTVVLNMAYDKDKNVRKLGYDSEIKSYKKVEQSIAACLNGIKGEVLTVCKLRGYESPLDMTLKNSKMDMETLDAMLSAMKESLGKFREYMKVKAKLLGHDKGLPFYEMYAPIVDVDMNFPYEKGTEFVVKNFRTFSDHLADFADNAIKSSWIDVEPREGKVGGGFCSGIAPIGQSRILLNYSGSFSDVITLAHELGHGFHGECLKDQPILNTDYPMVIAETASTFCETIVKKAAIKEASKKEALAILEQEISDCNQVIVDIYSRFLFEKAVFEKREESSLSVDEIKKCMIDAQKESYGDGLDQEYLHPYMWTWKPHYYSAEANYYNYPYAFGLLFAKGLYAEYLKRGNSFATDYEKLLAITGCNNVADITKVMNIDIHNIDFWRSSLKTIEDDIDKFIELSRE